MDDSLRLAWFKAAFERWEQVDYDITLKRRDRAAVSDVSNICVSHATKCLRTALLSALDEELEELFKKRKKCMLNVEARFLKG